MSSIQNGTILQVHIKPADLNTYNEADGYITCVVDKFKVIWKAGDANGTVLKEMEFVNGVPLGVIQNNHPTDYAMPEGYEWYYIFGNAGSSYPGSGPVMPPIEEHNLYMNLYASDTELSIKGEAWDTMIIYSSPIEEAVVPGS